MIDGDDDRALEFRGAVEVRGQIVEPAAERGGVRRRELIQSGSAMHFQRAHGRHDDDGLRREAALTAFDVHELLPAEIEGESGLRDGEIGMREGHARGEHAVAAVRDVRKRSAVQEGGHAFDALHEIRHQGIAQQRHERAGDAEFLREDRFAIRREAGDDALEPRAQIGEVFAQTKDRHDLGGGGDVESGAALGRFADAGAQLAQRAVIHVHDALPKHAFGLQAAVSIEELVVDDGGEQVVRAGDGVEVAIEVQIDRLRGLHGAFAAAGGTTFASEDGSHRWLAQREGDFLADLLQTLRQADGDGRFAFARWRRSDRGDEDELPTRRFGLQRIETDLGLVAAERDEVIGRDIEAGGDARDVWKHGGGHDGQRAWDAKRFPLAADREFMAGSLSGAGSAAYWHHGPRCRAR